MLLEWLSIGFVVIVSLAVLAWAPPPGSWVLASVSLSTCVAAAYTLLRGNAARATVLAGVGFLLVGMVPVYDWGVRPALGLSASAAGYGLLAMALLCTVVAPLIGILASRLLATPSGRPMGIVLLAAPAALAVLGGLSYVAVFVAAGPASRGSVQQRTGMALAVAPGLLALGTWLGVALHRAWTGQINLP